MKTAAGGQHQGGIGQVRGAHQGPPTALTLMVHAGVCPFGARIPIWWAWDCRCHMWVEARPGAAARQMSGPGPTSKSLVQPPVSPHIQFLVQTTIQPPVQPCIQPSTCPATKPTAIQSSRPQYNTQYAIERCWCLTVKQAGVVCEHQLTSHSPMPCL